MAWTTPSTRATGYIVTAANYNEIVNGLNHIAVVPVVLFPGGIAPDTNGAEIVQENGNTSFVLAKFDKDTEQHLDFHIPVPHNRPGSGDIKLHVHWHSGGTTGQVRWTLETVQIGATQNYNLTPGDKQGVSSSAQAGGDNVSLATITWSAPSLTAGNLLRCRLSREVAHADDTTGADAVVDLVTMEFEEA